jgi:hypothetical protein
MKNVILVALFALFFAGVGPTEAKKAVEINGGKTKVFFCSTNATTYHAEKTCTELSSCTSITTNTKKYAKKKKLTKCPVCFAK